MEWLCICICVVSLTNQAKWIKGGVFRCLQSTSSKSPSYVHAVLSDRQVFQNTFIHIAGFSSTSKRKKSFKSQNNLKRAIPEVVRNAFWYLLQFFVMISQWPSVATVSGSAYSTGGCGYHPEPRTGPA